MNRNLRFFSIVLILGGLSAASIAWDFWPKPKDNVSMNQTNAATIQVDNGDLNREQRFVTSYAPIVKKVSQSVVSIFTTTTIREVEQISPFDDPFFQQFFGQRSPFFQGKPRERVRKEKNLGSGVIVSKEGYIITNNHVVDQADEVEVSLTSGKTYQAKLVGKDPKTDVAVLKIEATDLTPILFGNSEKIEVGDIVLAIGNPFGIGQSVSMGIISALGRNSLAIEDYEDFIQTDAAINPGNSGGALVDAEGRLVGINTAILSRTGGNQGIGFAVPVDLARDIMERILKDGRIVNGFLGVNIQDEITPDIAKALNLPSTDGALVTEVLPQSPAEAAGLKREDVIRKIDDKPIQNSRQLRFIIGQKAPNTKVMLTIFRDGKEKNVDVVLQELKEEKVAASPTPSSGKSFLEGVVIGDLNANLRQQLQVPSSLQGAIVMNIDENALAVQEGRGLQRGDIITEFDRQPVKSADDLVKLSSKSNTNLALLRVWRRGANLFITINLEP